MANSTNKFSHALSVDIGGTFTDFSLLDLGNGEVTVHKLLTSSGEPARTVLQGISEVLESIGNHFSNLSVVVHRNNLVKNDII